MFRQCANKFINNSTVRYYFDSRNTFDSKLDGNFPIMVNIYFRKFDSPVI